ncbi:MAG: hypothetical protein HY276_08785 [Ignavibacteriales bacterium]|nr:hypothetical protein [Ignavibacteriales bacterium]MBI3788338.1 hypothetical protein [Ignavibacteriales bacterium]
MKLIICLAVLLSANFLMAQENTIASFAVWKPKDGLEQQFEAGYKKHLAWHKANGDKWNWYGWYVVSGPRFGYFIDATLDRTWDDFDSPVNPSGDREDNALHTDPFGEFKTLFRVEKLNKLSASHASSLKSKRMRLVTLSVNNIPSTLKIIERLKEQYQTKYNVKTFLTYKVVDGGDLNQIIIMLGADDFKQYGETKNLQEDLSVIEEFLKLKTITAINSEMLVYAEGMSLFVN